MQNGSIMRTERQSGPDVWEFRWREPGPDGKRKHRRMVVGSIDRVFASPKSRGRRPYWGQTMMRKVIRPAAVKAGITGHIGWHTFRHTYSSLLKANGADTKVMQELLRHASSRVTLDIYTQAFLSQKRKAQSQVVRLLYA